MINEITFRKKELELNVIILLLMDNINLIVGAGLVFLAATLYSSVGHAGASGYLAVMAILSVPASSMRPIALGLNIIVATIAFFFFQRAGQFSWKTFWPFALFSIPASFVGGLITVPGFVYKPIVSFVLLFAALRFVIKSTDQDQSSIKGSVPLPWAIVSGIVIGLLSGLTGVGGGIFLSPLLLFMGWATPRQASGVSAAFILVNSVAGLFAFVSSGGLIPSLIPIWGVAAILGGFLGAYFGSRRVDNRTIYRLLAAVLLIAGAKMLFT